MQTVTAPPGAAALPFIIFGWGPGAKGTAVAAELLLPDLGRIGQQDPEGAAPRVPLQTPREYGG